MCPKLFRTPSRPRHPVHDDASAWAHCNGGTQQRIEFISCRSFQRLPSLHRQTVIFVRALKASFRTFNRCATFLPRWVDVRCISTRKSLLCAGFHTQAAHVGNERSDSSPLQSFSIFWRVGRAHRAVRPMRRPFVTLELFRLSEA